MYKNEEYLLINTIQILYTCIVNHNKEYDMLQFNFKKIFVARGIEKPFTYLVKKGFSARAATTISNSEMRSMRLDMLEKVLITLNCTPNDVIEWYPTEDELNTLDQKHSLFEIRGKDEKIKIRLTKMINEIPLDKLEEIEQFIQAKKKE